MTNVKRLPDKRVSVIGMSNLATDKFTFGRLIHELGWERREPLLSVLRLAAALVAILLIVVIVGR